MRAAVVLFLVLLAPLAAAADPVALRETEGRDSMACQEAQASSSWSQTRPDGTFVSGADRDLARDCESRSDAPGFALDVQGETLLYVRFVTEGASNDSTRTHSQKEVTPSGHVNESSTSSASHASEERSGVRATTPQGDITVLQRDCTFRSDERGSSTRESDQDGSAILQDRGESTRYASCGPSAAAFGTRVQLGQACQEESAADRDETRGAQPRTTARETSASTCSTYVSAAGEDFGIETKRCSREAARDTDDPVNDHDTTTCETLIEPIFV